MRFLFPLLVSVMIATLFVSFYARLPPPLPLSTSESDWPKVSRPDRFPATSGLMSEITQSPLPDPVQTPSTVESQLAVEAQASEIPPKIESAADAASKISAKSELAAEPAPESLAQTEPTSELSPKPEPAAEPAPESLTERTPEISAKAEPAAPWAAKAPEILAKTEPADRTAPEVSAKLEPVARATPEVPEKLRPVTRATPEVPAKPRPVTRAREVPPKTIASARAASAQTPPVKKGVTGEQLYRESHPWLLDTESFINQLFFGPAHRIFSKSN